MVKHIIYPVSKEEWNYKRDRTYFLPKYVILPTGETTTAVPVQKTSSASSSSSTDTRRSSTCKVVWLPWGERYNDYEKDNIFYYNTLIGQLHIHKLVKNSALGKE